MSDAIKRTIVTLWSNGKMTAQVYRRLKTATAILVIGTLANGCNLAGPDIELNGVTLFGTPISFSFQNREKRPITIQRVVVNDDFELTRVLYDPRKREFTPTTLEPGDGFALDNPLGVKALTVTVYTDRGSITWDLD